MTKILYIFFSFRSKAIYCYALLLFVCVGLSLIPTPSFAITYFSRVAGPSNWDAAASWSTVACGGAAAGAFPIAGDIVTICAGHTIDVNVNSACTDLTINGGTLNFPTNSRTLTVSGNIVMSGTCSVTGASASRDLNVSGTFTVSVAALATINGEDFRVTGTACKNYPRRLWSIGRTY